MNQVISKIADSHLGKKEVAQGSTRPRESDTETMRAVVYLGRQKVGVEHKPKPLLTHPSDVIVKVTHSARCLHECRALRGLRDCAQARCQPVRHGTFGHLSTGTFVQPVVQTLPARVPHLMQQAQRTVSACSTFC